MFKRIKFNDTMFCMKSVVGDLPCFCDAYRAVTGLSRVFKPRVDNAHQYYMISREIDNVPVAVMSAFPYIQEIGDQYCNRLSIIIDLFEMIKDFADSNLGAMFLETFAEYLQSANTKTSFPTVYVAVSNTKCADLLLESGLWESTSDYTPIMQHCCVLEMTPRGCGVDRVDRFSESQKIVGVYSLVKKPLVGVGAALSSGVIGLSPSGDARGHQYSVSFSQLDSSSMVYTVLINVVPILMEKDFCFEIQYMPNENDPIQKIKNAYEVLASAIEDISRNYKNQYNLIRFYTVDTNLMKEMEKRGWTLNSDFTMTSPSQILK